ncbi:MAG: hypothetical protein ACREV7_17905 [Steroidobacteraceae bacterium]
MRGTKLRRGFTGTWVALLVLAGPATAAATSRHTSANTGLPKVTIEASKEREAVRREVDRFVGAVVVRPWDETLSRWNDPICPLVAGLPEDFGEFILRDLSRAALEARAPLAGKVCHPNLYVVASGDPDLLLKKWWARNPGMYDTRHGLEPVRRFLESKRPVRVWYNSALGCGDGGPVVPGGSALAFAQVLTLGGGSSAFAPGITCTDGIDTHLSYADVREISSAIIVVNLRRLKPVSIQQLADYIVLVGLADVRLDADTRAAPSILWLFSGHAAPPSGLTLWDRALLYSLYNTRQRDKRQVQDMEETMTGRIAP